MPRGAPRPRRCRRSQKRAGRVVGRLAGHARVEVVEELDPVDAEHVGRPRRSSATRRSTSSSPGASAFGRVLAQLAARRRHEHHTVALALGACHRAARGDRLVIGMGVEQDECVRHGVPQSGSGAGQASTQRSGTVSLLSGAESDVSVRFWSGTNRRLEPGGHDALTNCSRRVRAGARSRWPAGTRTSRKAAADGRHRRRAHRRSPRCRAPI